jgi:hypothetical protein
MQDKAQNFIENYQIFTKTQYTQPMVNMLNTVDITKNGTKTSENIKLTVTNQENSTSIKWTYSVNGADFPQKSVGVNFKDGLFENFGDGYNLYAIGSELKISREQAIAIALEHAKNYTFEVSKGSESYVKVDFKIDESKTETTQSAGAREPLTLYPSWNVQLNFDKMYGSYYGIQAVIWGDNGEIDFFNPTGTGGMEFPTGDEPTNSPTTSAPAALDGTYLLGGAIVAFAICISVIGVALKKKRRHN